MTILMMVNCLLDYHAVVYCFSFTFMHLLIVNGVSCMPLHTHTHTRLTALFKGLPRWAGTRKVKPIWILLKQETVSGSRVANFSLSQSGMGVWSLGHGERGSPQRGLGAEPLVRGQCPLKLKTL